MIRLLGEAKGVPYVLISWSSNARMAIFMEVYLKAVGVAVGGGPGSPHKHLLEQALLPDCPTALGVTSGQLRCAFLW